MEEFILTRFCLIVGLLIVSSNNGTEMAGVYVACVCASLYRENSETTPLINLF
jgi:hypothetical protein